MTLLVGAATVGFILALLGLGVFLSYRVYVTLDLTADGSFLVGAAVAAALLLRGVHPLSATLLAALAGAAAGAITGLLHTEFLISTLLAGVLTSTALYSISLFAMGSGNLSLATAQSLVTQVEQSGQRLLGLEPSTSLLIAAAVLVTGLAFGLAAFLRTDLGLAMRAAGSSPAMAKSLAIDVDRMTVFGLALSNGLIGFSGALYAQYQGFADIQMGIGALVTGLANLMLGEALLGRRSIGRCITGAVVGALMFRLLVALAIRAGLNPNALKLVTAGLVLSVLVLPRLVSRARRVPPPQKVERHA
jgi:putative ABC transport system permease protein